MVLKCLCITSPACGVNNSRCSKRKKRKPGRSVGVVIIIGFSLAIFLTSSIVASSIEAQAANLEDSLGQTIVVTASDASFDSSATKVKTSSTLRTT